MSRLHKRVGQNMPDIKPVEKRASVLSFKRKGKPASVKEEVVGINHPALKSNNFNARRTVNTINLTMRTPLF